ncbi:hypothetical protein [Noviherbaspirillum pedocola]|uniref:Uncharacterized protein n=1 Tax=Noviherbaspirillum pedocola TaxID=2801341 RepID=A0A934W4N9_9BURK|nr:hypothetical protein [Noviherbaspirillum pedocola]MBK4733030.1 hypothetical protein [Noviherbaspirillum pedocola]
MESAQREVQVCEPAADSVKAFQALLAKHRLGYLIVWTSAGWHKHGVIRVFPLTENGALDTRHLVFAEEFTRSNSSWGVADRVLGRVRTGSPKHRAILALLASLSNRFD